MTGDKANDNFIQLKSNIEQYETLLEDFAPVVATYFLSLCQAGIPTEIARDLTLDWHNIWWEQSLGRGK